MKVFVVISTRNATGVADAIRNENLEYFVIKGDAWLVAFDGTTRALAEKLGIRGGESGPGLVCSIDGYSGRLPKDAWEWLNLHEAKSD
jgi:hypothetical protein